MAKGKILFLVTEDWYFVSHRFEFATKLIEEGYEVSLATRVSQCESKLTEAGIEVYNIPFARERLDPFAVIKSAKAIRKVISDVRPNIVHLVALRAILVGWMATIGIQRPVFVNAITGLGSLFSPWRTTLRLRLVRKLVEQMLRLVLTQKTAYNVWQNSDDLEEFGNRGISPRSRSWLIRGAGINFVRKTKEPDQPKNDEPVVLFVGRFLREKGVGQLVEASENLIKKGVQHKLRLVGSPDDCNPLSYSSRDVEEWAQKPHVEYLGRRADIDSQMESANIIALPTYYREGLPRVLLEAGRAGRAAITCDIPGCRDVVVDGETGILVKPRDVDSLACGLERLIMDETLREAMGAALFRRVLGIFSDQEVLRQFLELYGKVSKR